MSNNSLICDPSFFKKMKLIYDNNIKEICNEYGFDNIEDLIDFAIKQAKGDNKKNKRKTKRRTFRKTKRKNNNNDWIFCDNKSSCYKILTKCTQCEIRSTYYWLRLLSDLMINGCIKIVCKKTNITGLWSNDSKFFSIQIGTKKGKTFIENKLSKCIFIFGPSASGKTYWTVETIKNILPIYYTNNLPKSYLTIDGGNMRESSMIYQMITKTCSKNKIKGLNNLVSGGIGSIARCKVNKKSDHCSLFNSSSIKSTLRKFLEDQKRKYNIKIPLVIPETFSDYDISRIKSLNKKVVLKKFNSWLKLSESKNTWIGILVWQHKLPKDCTFPPKKKCVGTIKSGTTRELSEGKKYSSGAYDISMRAGGLHLTSPGISLDIHNSGSKNKKSHVKIFHKKNEDIDKLTKIKDYLLKNNIADCEIVNL